MRAQNRLNAAVIDAAAERQIAAGQGNLPLSFQVVLTNRRGEVERLRAQQPHPPLPFAMPDPRVGRRVSGRNDDGAVAGGRAPPERVVTDAERIRSLNGYDGPVDPAGLVGSGEGAVSSKMERGVEVRVRGERAKKSKADVIKDIDRGAKERINSVSRVAEPSRGRGPQHSL